jgi:O-6-methylguanine DNA methyltransferase
MGANSKPEWIELVAPTPEGDFLAAYSERGLACLRFPSNGKPASGSNANRVSSKILHWHDLTTRALENALAGKVPGVVPPLDLSAGTGFQQSVWNALRRIRLGETRSYGQVARTIGNAKAVRAVGGACGANPIPVLIPCHRVLAANSRLGGFSADMKWKRLLLVREGARVRV